MSGDISRQPNDSCLGTAYGAVATLVCADVPCDLPSRYAGIEVMTSSRLPEFDLMYTDS